MMFGAGLRFRLAYRGCMQARAFHLLCGAAIVAAGAHVFGRATGSLAIFTGLVVAAGPLLLGLHLAVLLRTRRGGEAIVGPVETAAPVLIVLLMPLLSKTGSGLQAGQGMAAFLGLLVPVVLLAQQHVPEGLHRLVRHRGASALLVAVPLLCLVVGMTAYLLRLGLVAAAFLAGVLLSRVRLPPRITSVGPAAETLVSAAYYVLLGALIDPRFLWAYALPLVAAAIGVVLLGALLSALPPRGRAPAVGQRDPLHRARPRLSLGAFGLIVLYAGAEVGLYPAGRAAEGGQAVLCLTALLTLAPPLVRTARVKYALGGSRQRRERPPFPETARDPAGHLSAAAGREAARALPERYLVLGRRRGAGGAGAPERPCMQIVAVEPNAPAEGLQVRLVERWLSLRYELVCLCVWRGDVYLPASGSEFRLEQGDRIVLSGDADALRNSAHLFQSYLTGIV